MSTRSLRGEIAEFILSRSDPFYNSSQPDDVSGLDLGAQPMVDFFTYFERFSNGLMGRDAHDGLLAADFAEMRAQVLVSPWDDRRPFVGDEDVSGLVMLAPHLYSLFVDPNDPDDAPIYVDDFVFADEAKGTTDRPAFRATGRGLWGWLAEIAEVLEQNPQVTIDDSIFEEGLGFMGRRLLWYEPAPAVIDRHYDVSDIVAGMLGQEPIASYVPEIRKPRWLVEAFRQAAPQGAANVLEALKVLRTQYPDHPIRPLVDATIAETLSSTAFAENERCAELREDLAGLEP